MFDIKIMNGQVLGLDQNSFREADIGIRDGKIVELGALKESAVHIIDAKGFIVSPGFIDIHMHEEDYSLTENPEYDISEAMLNMGVTTAVVGNCGNNRQDICDVEAFIDVKGNPVNYMSYIGHNFLRQKVGNTNTLQESTPEQIEQMAELVQNAVDEGAIGVSFGLEYCKGITFAEATGICSRIVGRKDLLLSAHYRDDADKALAAIEEMAEIGRTLGIPFQISHLSSCSAFGNMSQALDLITELRKDGLDIMADAYPYPAFSTFIGSDVFAPGCFERWGKTFEAIELTESPYENVRCTKEIFEDARANYPDMLAICYAMNEEEVVEALKHPLVMVASDGIYRNHKGHPRGAGTFPKFIGKYLRDQKIIDFFEGMKKITCMPADRLHLADRKGYLRAGYDADIVVFNYDSIIDKATFGNAQARPEGIEWVILNGRIALSEGRVVDKTCGRFLRRPRQRR